MARTPHGYFDTKRILDDLAKGGFTQGASIDTVTHRSRADSARRAAVAYCQGTPLRNEIESRDPVREPDAPPKPSARWRAFREGARGRPDPGALVVIARK